MEFLTQFIDSLEHFVSHNLPKLLTMFGCALAVMYLVRSKCRDFRLDQHEFPNQTRRGGLPKLTLRLSIDLDSSFPEKTPKPEQGDPTLLRPSSALEADPKIVLNRTERKGIDGHYEN